MMASSFEISLASSCLAASSIAALELPILISAFGLSTERLSPELEQPE